MTESVIAPPIFIVDGLDVLMFLSVQEAEQNLEPIDVNSGIFTPYDSHGRLLQLDATEWRVTISLTETEPLHVQQLENSLRAYLNALGESVGNDPSCQLPCLIEACRNLM
jgi:hypothetical protein